MSGVGVLCAAVLVLAAAAALVIRRPRPVRRIAHLQTSVVKSRARASVGSQAREDRRRQWLLRATSALAAVATWLFVGGWFGVPAGALAGIGSWLVLRRMGASIAQRERCEAAAELPYGVDLLAAALRAGAPLDRALTVVGAAIGGPLGRRFDEVARALRLGATGVDGWRPLADVAGARALTAAAQRAAESGATLAAACTRAAAELRERRDAEADAAAQRAGVLIVLPLGACFLPAFVLVGVVPILLGVLRDVPL